MLGIEDFVMVKRDTSRKEEPVAPGGLSIRNSFGGLRSSPSASVPSGREELSEQRRGYCWDATLGGAEPHFW